MTDDQIHYEIVQSRKDLEQELGVPILTFSYPFGGANSAATDYVHFAGYIAAVGAKVELYCRSRREQSIRVTAVRDRRLR